MLGTHKLSAGNSSIAFELGLADDEIGCRLHEGPSRGVSLEA